MACELVRNDALLLVEVAYRKVEVARVVITF